jgi:hypothetical protein
MWNGFADLLKCRFWSRLSAFCNCYLLSICPLSIVAYFIHLINVTDSTTGQMIIFWFTTNDYINAIYGLTCINYQIQCKTSTFPLIAFCWYHPLETKYSHLHLLEKLACFVVLRSEVRPSHLLSRCSRMLDCYFYFREWCHLLMWPLLWKDR